MFEKSKEKRRLKKERKNIKPMRLKRVLANDKEIPAMNIRIHTEQDVTFFEIALREACEDLHFDNLCFFIESDEKKTKIEASFKNAEQMKRFYVYTFIVEDFREFYA